MNKKTLIMASVFSLLVLTSCSPSLQQTKPAQAREQTPTASAPVIEEESVSQKEIKEITVIGTEFGFTPSTINLKTGDRAKIIFKNDGQYNHDFVIENLGLATKIIQAGEQEVLEFDATKAGTYTIYCSVGTHRSSGMEGKLIIE